MVPPETPIIERLTPASRGSAWVWVVVGGHRVARVPAPVIKTCRVAPGGRFDAALTERIGVQTRIWLAQRDGAAMLKARARTRADVRKRLLAKGHTPADTDIAIARLVAAGIISDAAVTASRLTHHARKGGAGREMIREDLRQRGVTDVDAGRAVSKGTAPDAEVARAIVTSAAAKLPRALTPVAAMKRLLGALARRGIDEETAMDAIAAVCPKLAKASGAEE